MLRSLALSIAVIGAFLLTMAHGFTPPRPMSQHSVKMKLIREAPFALGMATEGDSSSSDATSEEASKELKAPPTSGTFYDDEVDPIPATKVGISNSMRDRLIQEASTGMDSETKQTNVILYIIGVVAVLVLLGGQGIFF